MVRQHDGLGPLGRAGGEEQDLSAAVLHARHQGKGELVAQLLVAPEQVDVGIAHQAFEHVRGQRGVKQHQLQPGKRGGKDLDHVVETAVAEKADAAFAPRAQLPGAFADGLVERAEGERRLFIAQRGGVGGRQGEMGEQMVKAVKSHGAPPIIPFFSIYHIPCGKESLLSKKQASLSFFLVKTDKDFDSFGKIYSDFLQSVLYNDYI